jgi:hypothetical protein
MGRFGEGVPKIEAEAREWRALSGGFLVRKERKLRPICETITTSRKVSNMLLNLVLSLKFSPANLQD